MDRHSSYFSADGDAMGSVTPCVPTNTTSSVCWLMCRICLEFGNLRNRHQMDVVLLEAIFPYTYWACQVEMDFELLPATIPPYARKVGQVFRLRVSHLLALPIS
jgi:hypothetical protein